jgi:hypothetical protein
MIQKTPVIYAENQIIKTVSIGSGITKVNNPEWFLQDSIGYINLLDSNHFAISSEIKNKTSLFSIGIEHGKNPKDETYAYVVYPNCSEEDLNRYRENNPILILSNTKQIQAVFHKQLNITQIHFYEAGTLHLADSTMLTVDQPCAVMIIEKDSVIEISVGNPLCESKNPEFITLQFSKFLKGSQVETDRKTSTLKIELPQGDFAGNSVEIMIQNEK